MNDSKSTRSEPLIPVYISIVAMIVLQLAISDKLTVGPKYLLAGFELLLLLGTHYTRFSAHQKWQALRQHISLLLIMVVSVTNIVSLGLVCTYLVQGHVIDGHRLLLSAIAIYLTNILIFGLWYWELDSPGLTGFVEPASGPDFMFPQMTAPNLHPACHNWSPQFFDYLYISITNATAFSPTDSLPLTHRAKLLMSVQSLASLVTVALVAARAVNILS